MWRTISLTWLLIVAHTTSVCSSTVGAVAVPAQAGKVEGTTANSDEFIWRTFIDLVKPVSSAGSSPAVFETWASDKDTFNVHPHWPTQPEPLEFHVSVLSTIKKPAPVVVMSGTIDVTCAAPPGAAVGGFPTEGKPAPCISEQVARNRPLYEYIVDNNLNTQKGLAAAYAKSLKVDMPPESVAIKGDWVPLADLVHWIPQLGTLQNAKKLYYVVTVDTVDYGLVSMHVSSRRNPNWVWGTFEHKMTPGRCDAIGCSDTFGAENPRVKPDLSDANSQYGECRKTKRLKTLMAAVHLSAVWENYCLKSTQVDYVRDDGTPFALGNSVIEGIVGNGTVAASSCISCHSYASFGPDGKPTASAKAILTFNPTGKPLPQVLAGSSPFAFNWGVLEAP